MYPNVLSAFEIKRDRIFDLTHGNAPLQEYQCGQWKADHGLDGKEKPALNVRAGFKIIFEIGTSLEWHRNADFER